MNALPTPIYQSPRVTLYCGDCREIMPLLRGVDAVVSDPPYGIGYQHSGHGLGIRCNRHTQPIAGDDVEFDPSHILALEGADCTADGTQRTPRTAIVLMGANHYARHVPSRGQWLSWDKSLGQGAATSFCEGEFGWTNRRNPRNVFRFFWWGAMRAGENNQGKSLRLHPSQKPVELMTWLMTTARIGLGKTVLDPYMGSGSTGVACLRTGRKFVGIEIDPDHAATAAKRIAAAEKEMGL